MNALIEKMIDRSNKTTIQTLVRNFDIERLGYMYADIIEDNFGVKKGTASFGEKVSDVFSDYKVNKIRLAELDRIIKNSLSQYKLHYSVDVKREQMEIHNKAVAEFTELNKPMGLFTRHCNKYLKTKNN